MRLISIKAWNFASYESISCEPGKSNKDLILIEGPTGAGKSTFCDVVPWGLFGRTAKDGNADEIINWATKETVETNITVLTDKNVDLTVIRKRGNKENDLVYFTKDSPATRGKDISDTQKQINEILGVDLNLYLAGSYYHEFSQTSQFFQSSAKIRRVICEQIVDLSLAKKLSLKIIKLKKSRETDLEFLESEYRRVENEIKTLANQQQLEAKALSESYHKNKDAEIEAKKRKIAEYSIYVDRLPRLAAEKKSLEQQIRGLKQDRCEVCGGPKSMIETQAAERKMQQILAKEYQYKSAQKDIASLYADIDEISSRKAPEVSFLLDTINQLKSDLEEMKGPIEYQTLLCSDVKMMQALVEQYRAVTIFNTIQDIQHKTNALLSNNFDGELSVTFDVEEADKVDVTIYKDGNPCVYTQLSKGQRQLLKFCFSLSVMQTVSNHSGVKFNDLFFDEALDGLDANFKQQAFSVFQTLALNTENIFVVEHSQELKALFNTVYSVELVNGVSKIDEKK